MADRPVRGERRVRCTAVVPAADNMTNLRSNREGVSAQGREARVTIAALDPSDCALRYSESVSHLLLRQSVAPADACEVLEELLIGINEGVNGLSGLILRIYAKQLIEIHAPSL